jgi:hypothetical protein
LKIVRAAIEFSHRAHRHVLPGAGIHDPHDRRLNGDSTLQHRVRLCASIPSEEAAQGAAERTIP